MPGTRTIRHGLRGRLGLQGGGGAGFRPDFFVDSVNGDDGNDGLTAETAVQTLTAVSALMSNSSKVGLAKGSTFTDVISEPSLTDVQVGAYGSGDVPIIDLAAPLTGWEAGVEANVYKVSGVVLEGETEVYVTVQEDDVLLQRVTSEALCSARAGSCYITADTGTVDIYVHASDSGDLTTGNGKSYGYSAREIGIFLGDRATVVGIEAKNPRSFAGGIKLGANSVLRDCILRNGNKHNALVGYGSRVINNQFLEGHYHSDVGIQLVIYSPDTVTDSPDTYVTGNTFKSRGLLASSVYCIYSHTSGDAGGNNIYIRENTFEDCLAQIYAATSNISGDSYFEDNYITFSPGLTTLPSTIGDPYITAGKYVRRNKVWFPEPWATTFTTKNKLFEGGKETIFEDNEIYSGPYWNWVLGASSGSPNYTARRNKVASLGPSFLYSQTAAGTVTDCSDNDVSLSGGNIIDIRNTATITACENNRWATNAALAFRRGGTTYNWTDWRGLGYDLTSTDEPQNKGAALARSGSLAGTIDDWPNIWLHINAQETASITESSGEVSAVADLARGGRDLALHAPAGTDKVSLTTQGGLPYFAPVNNGGLRTAATLDLNCQFAVMAAVVRLTGAVSSASAKQFIASFHGNDATGAWALGSVGAAWTNEVVTTQQGGAAGWAYTSGALSISADVPHLILCHYDPVANESYLRIDGVLVGAMTGVSLVVRPPTVGTKSHYIELLRGQAGVSKLGGYLGELLLTGPISSAAVAEIEAETLLRWGIS